MRGRLSKAHVGAQASLEDVAIAQALELANGNIKPRDRQKSLKDRLLEDTPFGRYVMFKEARKMVDKNTGGNYPAPYAILDVLSNNVGKDKKEALLDEATRFSKLAATTESQALIGVFFGMSAVKKHDYGEPKTKVNNIAVLGAGLMGAGIAQVSADNGKYKVFLKDRDAASVGMNVAHLSITSRLQSPGSVPSPPAFPFASFSSPPESRLSTGNMVTVSIPGWPSFPFFSMQSDLSQFRPVQDHTITTVVGSASIAKTTTCSLQLALSFVKEDRTAALVPNFATPLSV
jgi:hypothetical protein